MLLRFDIAAAQLRNAAPLHLPGQSVHSPPRLPRPGGESPKGYHTSPRYSEACHRSAHCEKPTHSTVTWNPSSQRLSRNSRYFSLARRATRQAPGTEEAPEYTTKPKPAGTDTMRRLPGTTFPAFSS